MLNCVCVFGIWIGHHVTLRIAAFSKISICVFIALAFIWSVQNCLFSHRSLLFRKILSMRVYFFIAKRILFVNFRLSQIAFILGTNVIVYVPGQFVTFVIICVVYSWANNCQHTRIIVISLAVQSWQHLIISSFFITLNR